MLIAIILASLYPIAGQVLRTGTLHVAAVWPLTRGNRLRLIAVSLLLTMALLGFDRLVQPVTNWLYGLSDSPPTHVPRIDLKRYVIDFPLSMLWTVAWAATVGIVLDALGSDSRAADRDRPATAGL